MNNTKRFSIIIPMYQVEDYISECLDSIVNQSYNNFEAIVVDDGSRDNSITIAREYEAQYPNLIRIISKVNGGLSDARNFGLKYAIGEYIIFLDSDDYLDKNTCMKLDEALRNYDTDIVIYNYVQFRSAEEEQKRVVKGDTRIITGKEYLMSPATAWNKCIRKELLIENEFQFPVGLWYEDRATAAKFLKYTDKIVYLNEILYHYRLRENSIMKQKTYNDKMKDIITALMMAKEDVDMQKYHDEIEMIFIGNLVFHNGIRLLDYKKYDEITSCMIVMNENFPKWEENAYFSQQSKGYRLFCKLLNKKAYRMCRILARVKTGGQNE